MPVLRLVILTTLTMMAFAGNSLLCRAALQHTRMDAASFTTLRLVSGAVMLWLLVSARRRPTNRTAGTWRSASALFVYAAGFSFAYLSLPAATGALLLFGAVQVTMIGVGLWMGERFNVRQWLGVGCAFGGLVGLLLPGLSAPPLWGAALMLAAGIAWGIYSLRGRGAHDPLRVTAGNFMRATVIAVAMSALRFKQATLDPMGVGYAVASGAVTSGVGYAIWYVVLPSLRATFAATLQLSVPVLAALGGVLLLHEAVTSRLVWASVAILGGIAATLLCKEANTKH